MAKLSLVKGSTSILVRIFVQDSTSTTGAGKTGLTAASFTNTKMYIARDDDGNAAATGVTLTDATRGTWSSGGIKEKDATNQAGIYELGLTNASLATGSRSATYYLYGTGIAPVVLEIELTGWDNSDAVHGGMSALPNTACTGNASLLTSGTGTAQLSVSSGQVILQAGTGTGQLDFTSGLVNVGKINGVSTSPVTTIKAVIGLAVDGVIATVTNQLTAAQIATGVWQDATAGDFTTASSIGKALFTGNFVPGAASGLAIVGSAMAVTGDLSATMKTSVQTAADAAITANALILEIEADTDTLTTGVIVSSLGAGVITAASIAAAALNGKGDWSTYAGGDTAGTTTLLGRVTGAVVLAGSAPGWYTAPVDVSANVSAIKAKTDSLTFTQANVLDAHVLWVNNIQVKGAGTALSPWGPV